MMNEFEKQLFECSFLIVSLLLKKYQDNLISKDDFKLHTMHKIEYLQRRIESIPDSTERKDIENIIHQCIKINN